MARLEREGKQKIIFMAKTERPTRPGVT